MELIKISEGNFQCRWGWKKNKLEKNVKISIVKMKNVMKSKVILMDNEKI